MSSTGKLFAQSLKGEFICKTDDGWKIRLSNKSPRFGLISSGAGYFDKDDADIFILTNEFKLLSFLRDVIQDEFYSQYYY